MYKRTSSLGKIYIKSGGKELEEVIFHRDLPKKIVHHRQASQKEKPSQFQFNKNQVVQSISKEIMACNYKV